MQCTRLILISVVLGSIAMAGSPDALRAEEPAVEYPAALRSIGYQPTDVLSNEEAHSVRGASSIFANQGMLFEFQGIGFFGNQPMEVSGSGGGLSTMLVVAPDGIAFDTMGTAVSNGSTPRIQGGVATEIGMFKGEVVFQGDASALDIVALPGSFIFGTR